MSQMFKGQIPIRECMKLIDTASSSMRDALGVPVLTWFLDATWSPDSQMNTKMPCDALVNSQ